MESPKNSTTTFCVDKMDVVGFVYDTTQVLKQDSPWTMTTIPDASGDSCVITVTGDLSDVTAIPDYFDVWQNTSKKEQTGSSQKNQSEENDPILPLNRIDIAWLTDDHDCDTCGSNYAEGAEVFLDGKCILSLKPNAYCFDSDDYPSDEVYIRLLETLGYTVNFTRLGNEDY